MKVDTRDEEDEEGREEGREGERKEKGRGKVEEEQEDEATHRMPSAPLKRPYPLAFVPPCGTCPWSCTVAPLM